MHAHLPTIHFTTLVIAICAGLGAERVLVAYPAWRQAKRKGRMWLPYELFGLVGLVVLALRPPAYSTLAAHAHPKRRAGYTHTGFSGPTGGPNEPDPLPTKRKKRVAPLAEYHLPYGLVDERPR